MRKKITINQTGFYEYFVKDESKGGHGRIALVANETNSLPNQKKLEIARYIVEQDAENHPIISLGIDNAENSLGIDIDKKYLKEEPNAHSFFIKRYTEMIPFDVKITIKFGEGMQALTG